MDGEAGNKTSGHARVWRLPGGDELRLPFKKKPAEPTPSFKSLDFAMIVAACPAWDVCLGEIDPRHPDEYVFDARMIGAVLRGTEKLALVRDYAPVVVMFPRMGTDREVRREDIIRTLHNWEEEYGHMREIAP
jgi:hypothetical protein